MTISDRSKHIVAILEHNKRNKRLKNNKNVHAVIQVMAAHVWNQLACRMDVKNNNNHEDKSVISSMNRKEVCVRRGETPE